MHQITIHFILLMLDLHSSIICTSEEKETCSIIFGWCYIKVDINKDSLDLNSALWAEYEGASDQIKSSLFTFEEKAWKVEKGDMYKKVPKSWMLDIKKISAI